MVREVSDALTFPIHELMVERRCYQYLLQGLHPEGFSPLFPRLGQWWIGSRPRVLAGAVVKISLPIRTFDGIVAEYGVPYFLKIDIERAGYVCLKSLSGDIPQYLSFEAGRDSFDMLLMLASRGYSRFSLIRQDTFEPIVVPFAGTMLHVKWSARQIVRLSLRKHSRLHKGLTHLLPKIPLRERAISNKEGVHRSGPTQWSASTAGILLKSSCICGQALYTVR